MPKSNRLRERQRYVLKRLSNADFITEEVGRLADELFKSEETIWRDYRQAKKEERHNHTVTETLNTDQGKRKLTITYIDSGRDIIFLSIYDSSGIDFFEKVSEGELQKLKKSLLSS